MAKSEEIVQKKYEEYLAALLKNVQEQKLIYNIDVSNIDSNSVQKLLKIIRDNNDIDSKSIKRKIRKLKIEKLYGVAV